MCTRYLPSDSLALRTVILGWFDSSASESWGNWFWFIVIGWSSMVPCYVVKGWQRDSVETPVWPKFCCFCKMVVVDCIVSFAVEFHAYCLPFARRPELSDWTTTSPAQLNDVNTGRDLPSAIFMQAIVLNERSLAGDHVCLGRHARSLLPPICSYIFLSTRSLGRYQNYVS